MLLSCSVFVVFFCCVFVQQKRVATLFFEIFFFLCFSFTYKTFLAEFFQKKNVRFYFLVFLDWETLFSFAELYF